MGKSDAKNKSNKKNGSGHGIPRPSDPHSLLKSIKTGVEAAVSKAGTIIEKQALKIETWN